MTRQEAERKLKIIFGFDRFYERQWETIEKIFQGNRVLLIEKTGFGKSLCYQFPATQFEGTTIIFSPLIALMRDQVKKLNELGISAKCINSNQSTEENNQIIEEAQQGKLKLLYVAPERQENYDWINAARQLKIAMVVVDEAHCISVWGHDFRPAYRRIINLVNLLPTHFPVLATTATATKRVQEDIVKQMGGGIQVIRGNLLRYNFRLRVILVKSEDEKFAWLGENITKIAGSGIVYTGTRVATKIYADWFNYLNIPSVAYHGGLTAESRKDIEQGLLENRWKCIVSTNALGMGIDKPDIRFIVHIQIPQSPIHYYQEIGRAGRDGYPTYGLLFYNHPEDKELPIAFIDTARPPVEKYQQVIELLQEEPFGLTKLMKRTNLRRTQLGVILADLIEQGIAIEIPYGRRKEYEFQFNAPELDTHQFTKLREAKCAELDTMVEYTGTEICRMKFLCNYLGDTLSEKCGKCDNDLRKHIAVNLTSDWKSKLAHFKNNLFPCLEVESKRGKSILVNGVAASYYGFSDVGATIHKCKYEQGGDFPDDLLQMTLNAFRKRFHQEKFDLVVYIPPTESSDLVKTFTKKIAAALNLPISHHLQKSKKTKPQKMFQNFVLKRSNVKDAFTYLVPNEVKGKSVLLIDDIYDSGTTIREIGILFTKLEAKKLAPLVIAKTIGGDLL
ncbi:MAG: RecQ family ATP-dependent DNA helicase [bacterium]|nr:RecQ family ATP-dependent DNA helicase [bacterium]